MATFSSLTQNHLLQAVAEYDARGEEEFLAVHGFEPLPAYALVHQGQSYDLRAVVGVAHRFATGRLATAEEFASSMDVVVTILRRRGFGVTEPAAAVRTPTRSGTSRTPARSNAGSTRPRPTATRARTREEVPPAICPTCSMALPATGRCDDCG
ncbi:hypothetical protein N866_19850 [Actinotalea ferrariae CF5-4]|uniref:ScoMcrA-like N-terminal head domain-containing protein n=1 Tax=Actinotalea ferrariae CF5-4 TaxID=948458 RepID=A0A021VWX2_9CELL|nr:hypothetical protein [Actinotalea ferrariae]EYR63572.1 hypothetical protein N866_19850 [Actinotalea ferrariae CF5-4]